MRRFLVFSGWLFLAGGVGLGSWYFLGENALQARLATLKAKGQPTTASEVNAYYAVPKGVTDSTALWTNAIIFVEAANLSARGNSLPYLGEGPTPVPPPGQPWPQLNESRALVASLQRELQLIHKAADAGGQVRFPIDCAAGVNTLLPNTQKARQIVRLLALDADVCAHDGRSDQALKDVRAIYALSNAMRGEPFVISQLVRIALQGVGTESVQRLLPRCEWTDEDLASLQEVIRSAQIKDEMAFAFGGERANCLTAINSMPLGPFAQPNSMETLNYFDRSLEGLNGSWPDALKRHQELNAELKSLAGNAISRVRLMGMLLLLPALQTSVNAGMRAEARQSCTVLAIAAQRYRLKTGHLPETLAEISDPESQFVDPYDNQPLRFQSNATRIVIYSIGENQNDDGGQVTDSKGQLPPDLGISIEK